MYRSRASALAGAVVAAAFVLAGFLFFAAPGLMVSDAEVKRMAAEGALPQETERLKARNEVRTTGVQLVAVLVVVAGSLLTWRTVRLTRENQITDRYAAAIGSLDAGKPEATQVGAIFALERLARDSRRDHWPIMEILVGFLRDQTPLPQGQVKPPVVTAQVQAIATVLSRRRSGWDGRGRLRLEGLDLRSVRLTGADLRRANLSESDLSGAFLERAKLDRAKLLASRLCGAHLDDARARRASLKDANFRGARLLNVDFRKAIYGRNDFHGADTTGARGLPRFLLPRRRGYLSGCSRRGALKVADREKMDID